MKFNFFIVIFFGVLKWLITVNARAHRGLKKSFFHNRPSEVMKSKRTIYRKTSYEI